MLSCSRGSDIGCGKRQTHETLMCAVLDETQFWLGRNTRFTRCSIGKFAPQCNAICGIKMGSKRKRFVIFKK
jgi:hypothetical protein